jgi:dTDP-4-dehydrorhamnose reductase
VVDLLVTGGSGFVGGGLLRFLSRRRRAAMTYLDRPPPEDVLPEVERTRLDVRDEAETKRCIRSMRPRWVIHAAGIKDVRLCDGRRGNYRPEEIPYPQTVYGRTKLEGEKAALEESPGASVCRTGGVYGRCSPLLGWVRSEIQAGRVVEAFTDVYNTPTYAGQLADMLSSAMARPEGGIWHMTGGERVSRFEFFRTFVRAFGIPEERIVPSVGGARRAQMLLAADASLSSLATVEHLGVSAISVAEGMARLKDEGGL